MKRQNIIYAGIIILFALYCIAANGILFYFIIKHLIK